MFQGHRTLKRLFIGFLYLVVLAGLLFGVYRAFIRTAPTCSDGLMNQNETGIDCGGVCGNVCEEVASQPIAVERVSVLPGGTGRVDLLAEVYNPNDVFGAASFAYVFEVRDASGTVVATKSGESFILPQERKSLLAIGLSVAQSEGATAVLRVTDAKWQRFSGYQAAPRISVYRRRYSEIVGGPGFGEAYGLVANESPYDFRELFVKVILRDDAGRPLAVNQTAMQTVTSGEERDFRLVWPEPFPGTVASVDMQIDVNAYSSDNFVKQYLPGGRFQEFAPDPGF